MSERIPKVGDSVYDSELDAELEIVEVIEELEDGAWLVSATDSPDDEATTDDVDIKYNETEGRWEVIYE